MTGERAILVLDDDPDVALAARFALAELVGRVDGATSLDDLEDRLKARPYERSFALRTGIAHQAAANAGRPRP